MARIMKLVKAYGATTITTSRITLGQQTIKPLGDVIDWALYYDVTSTK